MAALLGRWEVEVLRAATVDEALAKMAGKPDVLLVDYHLHDRLDGLDTLDALRAGNRQLPGALLTADGSDTLKQAERATGYRVLPKQAKPGRKDGREGNKRAATVSTWWCSDLKKQKMT